MASTPDKTKARGALTPGLAALLDKTSDQHYFAHRVRESFAPRPTPRVSVDPDQLSLFDINDAGDFTSFAGETL